MRHTILMLGFVLACGHSPDVRTQTTPAPAPPPKLSPVADACSPEEGPAAEILRRFRAELLAEAEANPQAVQGLAQERLSTFRKKNQAPLAAHAAWALRHLPLVALPDVEAMPNHPRVTPDVAARMRGLVDAGPDTEESPFRAYLDLLAFDPIRSFAAIRGVVRSAGVGPSDLTLIHENILEGLAPPRLVRLNTDVDRPILAMLKRADIFVVGFERNADSGGYAPKRIRWVHRDPPAQPIPTVATAEDALTNFSMAVEALRTEEGDTLANISSRALDRVVALSKQWLDPHARLLRAHADCACRKIPRAPLPDLTHWKEEDNLTPLAALPPKFPRLRWDPVQAFLFLRSTVESRSRMTSEYSALSLVDTLVPLQIARTSDEANEPVLFLVEGDTAIVVDFYSTPEKGFLPTNVRHFQKP